MNPKPRAARAVPTPAAVVLMLSLLALGCAAPRATPEGAAGVLPTRPLTLKVVNQGLTEVLVYVVDGTAPRRLGPAAAQRSTVMRIHRAQPPTAPLLLMVRPVRSPQVFVPDAVWPRLGQVVELTVDSDLSASRLVAR